MSYIEFWGPPGSGKTTEANRLVTADKGLNPGRRSMVQVDGRARVSRIGLPPGGGHMWGALVAGMPRDLRIASTFLLESKGSVKVRLKRARTLLLLLVKSRALAVSPLAWVVDQGLQQWVLSCLAIQVLDVAAARRWQERLQKAPWGPDRLQAVNVDRKTLEQRVEMSGKHRRQSEAHGVKKYSDTNIQAFLKLRG